ncbi:molybdenum cofactor guanylyltransferase [Virgibacillus necropolis]|uniref:molybdenum cofactor guanylyltransferase n=1 Tax=Virgibacillus necropolis TaxID=163877 RepID=UPI00384FB127
MLTGAILAGGPNDTFDGTLKSFLPFDGQVIITKQIHEMKKVCSEILVVTNQPRSFLSVVPRDIRIITDYHKQMGPLGGIHAALSLANRPTIWIVACGMPFIDSKVVKYMLKLRNESNCQAVLPVLAQDPVYYHSLYRKNIIPEIEEGLFANAGHPSFLLNHINWIQVNEVLFTKNELDPLCLSEITTI